MPAGNAFAAIVSSGTIKSAFPVSRFIFQMPLSLSGELVSASLPMLA
jgi:hypothetical protein